MFIVDFTPAGFPIGVFEDEVDPDWDDDPDTWVSKGFSWHGHGRDGIGPGGIRAILEMDASIWTFVR
jgi:hypothetical protein